MQLILERYALRGTMDPEEQLRIFRRTAHLKIQTAEHMLVRAWVRTGRHAKDLVYEQWHFAGEYDKVNTDVFEPIRQNAEFSCDRPEFSCQYHRLVFRWSCK